MSVKFGFVTINGDSLRDKTRLTKDRQRKKKADKRAFLRWAF